MKNSDSVKSDATWDVCHVASGHEITDTRIFRRECTLLRESGFNVSLMAQHDGEDVVEGIRIHGLPVLGVRWYLRWLVLFPILVKLLTQRHHLVHFHDPDLLPVMLAYSWLTRKPVVWDAHENYESVITSNNKLKIPALSRMAGRVYNFVELKACRLAGARVVTVSEPMADRYRKAGLNAIVCANYVDHRQIPSPPQVKPVVPPLLAMTGTLRGETFEMELIEAFSLLRKRIECRLAFWGEIWPPFENELRQKVKEMGVEDAVEWAGPFPWKQLMTELIPRSTVAVYMADPKVPQFRNEIPNRLFEYWANSLPVIVSNGTLCGELVQRVNGGLTVNYGNTSELVGSLDRLLKDPNLRRELGTNGRRAVLQDYNWVKEGSKLIDLYDDLLANRFPEMCANRWTSSESNTRNREPQQGGERHGEAGYVGIAGE